MVDGTIQRCWFSLSLSVWTSVLLAQAYGHDAFYLERGHLESADETIPGGYREERYLSRC